MVAGQLYFFRALFHFEIMQYWGGIPYIDFLIPSDAVFNYPRLTYQACADKAGEDFKKAAELLPVDWDKTTVGKETLGKTSSALPKLLPSASWVRIICGQVHL